MNVVSADDPILSRACPTCGRSIRAAATLCGYCWSHVVPVDADGEPLASWSPPEPARPWWKLWGP